MSGFLKQSFLGKGILSEAHIALGADGGTSSRACTERPARDQEQLRKGDRSG